jgi:hypothetical protein
MSRIVWDQTGEKTFETGVDRGVVYPIHTDGTYPSGFAWNGLIGVTESPSGAEITALWADNIKYLNLQAAEEFGLTIEAYGSPAEFDECDGTAEVAPGVSIGQQTRKTFGFCYRTLFGNDIEGQAYGYKLHLVYGCLASPSEKNYQSVNESPEAATLSWEVTTTPVPVTGFKPTALVVVDSTTVDAADLAILEDLLYGKDLVAAALPTPDAVKAIFAA